MEDLSPFDNSYGIEYPEGDVSLERIPYTHVNDPKKDIIHTVLDGESILSIAYKYYGNSGLWGVISDTNSLINVMEEVVPGLQLLIPNGRK